MPVNSFAHRAAGFAGWHRVFLGVLEWGMNDVMGYPEPALAVPYWDWTDAESTADLFTDHWIGNGGNPDNDDCISGSPFATWNLPVMEADGISNASCIQRALGSDVPEPPTLEAVQEALRLVGRFSASPW